MGSKIRGYRLTVYLLAGLMVLLVLAGVLFSCGLAWVSRQIVAEASRGFQARDVERTLADLLLSMERNRRNARLLKKPEYQQMVAQDQSRFLDKADALRPLLVSEAERQALDRLRGVVSGGAPEGPLPPEGPAPPGKIPAGEENTLLPLEDVQRLLQLNQTRMDLHLKQMDLLVERTLITGTALAAASVLLAGVLSFFLIRSVTGPIRRLQQGTREIAAGRLSHRVELPNRDELGDLAEAFNDMALQLKRVDELKTDFIAIVSHELRTPLTSMKEAVELLNEEAVGPVTPKQRNLLKIAAGGIERLSGFVSDILNLTKLEGGIEQLNNARMDFQGLVQENMQAFKLLADRKGVSLGAVFETDPFPPVMGDAARLRQVLANLLNNAVQHTPAGGRVSVKVGTRKGKTLAPRLSDPVGADLARPWVCVSVSDSGQGIPREEWNRVFDKFYQLRRRNNPATGSGLGLSIARSIVEAHHGLIWVEASSAAGSTLVFAIPQEQNAAQGWPGLADAVKRGPVRSREETGGA